MPAQTAAPEFRARRVHRVHGTKKRTSGFGNKTKVGTDQDLASFLLVAFGFGLARHFHAVRVPDDSDHAVVFPKQTRSRASGDPVLPGDRCDVHRMGLLVTAALGPFGVVQLGSNHLG